MFFNILKIVKIERTEFLSNEVITYPTQTRNEQKYICENKLVPDRISMSIVNKGHFAQKSIFQPSRIFLVEIS
jgi:hypothetical protein